MTFLEQRFDFAKGDLGSYAIRSRPFVRERLDGPFEQITLDSAQGCLPTVCLKISDRFTQGGEQLAFQKTSDFKLPYFSISIQGNGVTP